MNDLYNYLDNIEIITIINSNNHELANFIQNVSSRNRCNFSF
jgi:hypothetical protein